MLIRDLTKRTVAEELWLSRRSSGLTGRQMATRLGLTHNRYWNIEGGRVEPKKLKVKPVARPELPLLLSLARKRSGMGLWETAEKVGVSHVTLLEWERTADERLIAFWEKRGFTFV